MPVKRPAVAKAKKKVVIALVQSAGPGMMFTKDSFFVPSRGLNGGKVAVPVPVDEQPMQYRPFVQQRRFLHDKETGEAYAEWVNNVAVCIHTGEELFRSRTCQEDECGYNEQQPFDYSVPKQQHPNDYSISTDDIVASGFLTLGDFKMPNGAAIRLADYERHLKRVNDGLH